MKLANRISLRYIFSIRDFHFITFITIISVIGIVIGVAALICVNSIFNGFGEFTEKQLISYDPHIRITPQKGVWLDNYEPVISSLKSNPRIVGVSPVISGRVIIIKSGNIKVLQLNGFIPNEFSSVSGIDKSMVAGKFRIDNSNNQNHLVLGPNLSYSLKAMPGSEVNLMSLDMVEKSVKTMREPEGVHAVVSGIFQTNNQEYDDTYGICSFETASHLFNNQNRISSIDIRLKDLNNVDEVRSELQKTYPQYRVSSWYDLHKELYNILKFERISVFIVLSLIIIIAVFNVLSSLSMTVVEKRHDISLLKAIGASDKFIKQIFIRTGLIIGTISTLIGSLLGLGLCYSQIWWGWIKISGEAYLVTALPVKIDYFDIVLVIVVSLFLSLISTIYPASRAASTKIIESLRAE